MSECIGIPALTSHFVIIQRKVEDAERKQKQSQEQLEGIMQQLTELQSKCSELKAEASRRNAIFKSSEVSDQTVLAFL